MPYINENARLELDDCIDNMVECLTHGNNVSNEEFTTLLGEINYSFTRILTKSMGEVSYSKIAMVTGVLENVKQEFYRRIAAAYEEKKIVQNGDIKEYKYR
jgi:hypothetical protein|tara:strand:+ start:663 stop:965 length:303 start_codon:yes stop_codon:yes gene_type:complete